MNMISATRLFSGEQIDSVLLLARYSISATELHIRLLTHHPQAKPFEVLPGEVRKRQFLLPGMGGGIRNLCWGAVQGGRKFTNGVLATQGVLAYRAHRSILLESGAYVFHANFNLPIRELCTQ
jgi:hypothetical protein